MNTPFQAQKGFTLIGLMIVIAILGIPVVVAVPTYQNHIGRAQVSEALYLADDLKTEIGIASAVNNRLPNAENVSGKRANQKNKTLPNKVIKSLNDHMTKINAV